MSYKNSFFVPKKQRFVWKVFSVFARPWMLRKKRRGQNPANANNAFKDERKTQLFLPFKNWPVPASFCLVSFYSNNIFTAKNFALQQDSNLDRRLEARWPPDRHHHNPLSLTFCRQTTNNCFKNDQKTCCLWIKDNGHFYRLGLVQYTVSPQ